MHIVCCADTHYGNYRNGPIINGVNGRLLDIQARMQEVFDYTVSNHINMMVIAGDIFRTKTPETTDLNAFAKFLEQCINKRINVYVLLGNHDKSKSKATVHALSGISPLVQNSCIKIIDQPLVEAIDGQVFRFFPFMDSPQDQYLRHFLKDASPTDILFAHGTVEGAVVNAISEYEISDGDSISMKTLAKVGTAILGDIHAAQNFGNVWYCGSVENLDFGDEQNPSKRFLDITVDHGKVDIQSILLHPRTMKTIHYSQMDEVKNKQLVVKDCIVRVMGCDKNYIEDVRRILNQAGVYFIDAIYTMEQTREEVTKTESLNVAEFVKTFAEKTSYGGDVDAASKIVVELLNSQPA